MSGRKTKIALVYRPDSFDIAYAKYFSEKTFTKLHHALNERRFRIGDKDISYRVLSHWDASGVLPDGVQQEQGWRRFSFVEMVWLDAVKRLRGFGLPLERIAEAKKQIMDWQVSKSSYPIFELYVAFAWATHHDPYIAVLSDGTAYIATLEEIKITQQLFYEDGDVLLVSIKSILSKSGHTVPPARNLAALSKSETEVIKALRSGDKKKVNINLKSNRISEIETIEGYAEAPVLSELHKALSEKGVFAELITRHSDGDLQSADVIRRQRFK